MNNKFSRFIIDSSMLVMFLALLALPITSIGLSGVENKGLGNKGGVLGTSSQQDSPRVSQGSEVHVIYKEYKYEFPNQEEDEQTLVILEAVESTPSEENLRF